MLEKEKSWEITREKETVEDEEKERALEKEKLWGIRKRK